MQEQPRDVVIIGGGPAGSSAATFLAKKGRSILVVERDHFPRFHIGESLLPYTMSAFERMGVSEKLVQAGFMPKYGAEIVSGCGQKRVQFYFRNGYRPPCETAYQVVRADFDKLLLDHARECGAEVLEGTSVEEVDTEVPGGGCRLMLKDLASGRMWPVESRYVLDCSGRHSVLGRTHGQRKAYPELKKIAVYAHFEGCEQPEGIDGTLTVMVRNAESWFWIIPLTQTRLSIGIVMDLEKFRARQMSPEAVLEEEIARQPRVNERLKKARRVTKVYTSGDYSYRHSRLTGENWMLVGDAAGFIDPVFSSGIFLAIMSGEMASDCIDGALKNPAQKKRLFRDYEKRLGKVMDLYLKFVRGWYSREFVETILNPVDMLRVVQAVNAVLAGNPGVDFQLRWRLWLFHAIVAMQRLLPVSPRLTLQPQ